METLLSTRFWATSERNRSRWPWASPRVWAADGQRPSAKPQGTRGPQQSGRRVGYMEHLNPTPKNHKAYLSVPSNYKYTWGKWKEVLSSYHKYMKYMTQDIEGKRTYSRMMKRICGEKDSSEGRNNRSDKGWHSLGLRSGPGLGVSAFPCIISFKPNNSQKLGPILMIPSCLKNGQWGYGKDPPGVPVPALPLTSCETSNAPSSLGLHIHASK